MTLALYTTTERGVIFKMAPMPEKFSFTITEEDIAQGERGSPVRCPVARALRRVVSDWGRPLASPSEIEIFTNAYQIKYAVPKQLKAAMINFDLFGKFTPKRFFIFPYGNPLTGTFEIHRMINY
jgi:hypothetical protein